MTEKYQSTLLCAEGSNICKQTVSHFYKFVEGTAYCVWCQESISNCLKNHPQDKMNLILKNNNQFTNFIN